MTWTLLHAKLQTLFKQRSLLPKGDRLLIALSGGQDSVCLTQLLIDLQPYWHWQLAIAHCNHGWPMDRGLPDRVRQLAQRWQLPLHITTAIDLPETEAAARHWRYSALSDLAQTHDYSTVVTGHTRSDRAETFLFNLIRGSGSQGLGAMDWARSLTENCRLVRPMLSISRQETGKFCRKLGLDVWDDRANQDLRFARNRLRLTLIPLIKREFNPQIEQSLAQTAEILRAEADYLDRQTQLCYTTACDRDSPRLNRVHLQTLPLALQRRLIKHFWSQWLDPAPNFEKIEAIIQLIDAPQRSRTPSLSQHIFAEVTGDWITLQGIAPH
jgi:tRNA(Ile)-lysidine synthase